MFEPLRRGATPELDPLKRSPYLAPDDDREQLVEPFRRMLDGRIRDPWMDHLNRAIRPRRRLVKEIRANALVPWIARQFPDVPVVVIIRQPWSVVRSRLNLGWEDQLDWYLRDESLLEASLGGDASDLRRLTDPVSRSLTQWMFESWAALTAETSPSVIVTPYEKLRVDAAELERVLSHSGQTWDDAVESAWAKKSRTTAKPVADTRPAAAPEAARRTEMLELLERFGLPEAFAGDPPITPGRAS